MRLGRVLLTVAVLGLAPEAADGKSRRAEHRSGITAVGAPPAEPVGAFDGRAFERVTGTVSGRVAGTERIAGLAALVGRDGVHEYTSGFEVIRPVDEAARSGVVVVEAENRGSPLLLGALNSFAVPSGAPQA